MASKDLTQQDLYKKEYYETCPVRQGTPLKVSDLERDPEFKDTMNKYFNAGYTMATPESFEAKFPNANYDLMIKEKVIALMTPEKTLVREIFR